MKEIAVFEKPLQPTAITRLDTIAGNEVFIKREDFIPFSFGGNKARKAYYFYKDIKKQGCDAVVTYGSSSSNHCRIIANLCCAMQISCHIISPSEDEKETQNTGLIRKFGAVVEKVPVDQVHDALEQKQEQLRAAGKKPYFIMGGGHGNLGTQAYVDAYREICAWEEQERIAFDYIFHASGTGTTQAGLVCGQLIKGVAGQKIIGISIARPQERGREVIAESITDYLAEQGMTVPQSAWDERLVFTDAYRLNGYGQYDLFVRQSADHAMKQYGIPMDTTYVGKAFAGMKRYLEDQRITGQKILFLHTGGTPLFFEAQSRVRKLAADAACGSRGE